MALFVNIDKHQLEKVSKGGGMNNYWDHEPEFFWYKKNVRKSQEFLTQRSDPSRFFEKILDVICLRPLTLITVLIELLIPYYLFSRPNRTVIAICSTTFLALNSIALRNT